MVDGVLFEARGEKSAEFLEDGGVFGIGGEVGEFVGVGVVVVEFETVFACVPFGASPAGGADGAAPEFGIGAAASLGEDGVVNFGGGVAENGAEAEALEI